MPQPPRRTMHAAVVGTFLRMVMSTTASRALSIIASQKSSKFRLVSAGSIISASGTEIGKYIVGG